MDNLIAERETKGMVGKESANTLFWATIGYARWWLAVDAPFLAQVDPESRTVSQETASRFLYHYKVRRGFLGADSGPQFSEVVEAANRTAETWPAGLMGRHEACQRLAEEWQSSGLCSQNSQKISAATKIMWLLRPQGWTVYDRFVRLATGSKNAVSYYGFLNDHGFEETRDEMQNVIDQSDWLSIPAAKLIDFYLMERGASLERQTADGNSSETHHRAMEGFLNALPLSARNSLIQLAHKLDEHIAGPLFRL